MYVCMYTRTHIVAVLVDIHIVSSSVMCLCVALTLMLVFLADEPPLPMRSRHRLQLPCPEWLRVLLAGTGRGGAEILDGLGFRGTNYTYHELRRISLSCHVHGIAVVGEFRTMGTVFDTHDREAELMFDFVGSAGDAYSMTISSYTPFSDGPVAMTTTADGKKVTWRHSGFVPNRALQAQHTYIYIYIYIH